MNNSTHVWLVEFCSRLENEHVIATEQEGASLTPARLLLVENEDWGRTAEVASAMGLRWSGVWGEHIAESISITACFVHEGDYLLLRTQVQIATPVLTSHTPHYPAADRPERHLQDMFGVAFTDHPDARRWTRHQAWSDSQYPLRRNFPVAGTNPGKTPPDADYRFLQAHGAGVYEIPVGPVHAGIIEPGHFRFQAVGEDVLNLEERLAYVHKGIEKIAEGRDATGLARLAGRVSGDSTVAHCWAACMAMERIAQTTVPERALALRAVMAERERVANHLGDIGAICNDVAFTFAFFQFGRLRELWQRVSAAAFGHRFMMDRVVPGGVAVDLDADGINKLLINGAELRSEVEELFAILDDYPSLEDRLVTTGVLQTDTARLLGALGYVGRASGMDLDVRRDCPYPPYDRLPLRVPVFDDGDVQARVKVRAEEILVSLELIEKLLHDLPAGDICNAWKVPAEGGEGLGIVEGWRGEIISYVRVDDSGNVMRYFPRDPSWLIWPALEQLIHGNIVPDFPVCNKSVNGSYSGQDL